MDPGVLAVIAAIVVIIIGTLFYVALGEIRDAAQATAKEAAKQTRILEHLAGRTPPPR